MTPETKQLGLFWSYREWFAGNKELGIQILGNIAFFVPLGFMLSAVCRRKWVGIGIAFLLSCLVEASQLLTFRGLFEFDDILDNTLGAALGVLASHVFGERKIGLVFSLICVLGFSIVCLLSPATPASSSRVCCFQVDEDLTGFFFLYQHDTPDRYELFLESTRSGERIKPDVEYGLERRDVNEYFVCDYDYSRCGFRITSLPNDGEYEFIVKYSPLVTIHTDVYVNAGTIQYTQHEAFVPPHLEEEFVRNGWLRVYRPDRHCWVYQYEDALYWVVDKKFYFHPSGETLIQYHLWTTQIDRLPRYRLEHEWFWDNISGYFESSELEGDFGDYRVMKRELPKEYAITDILTGYYEDGHWIWGNHFRPIYDL